MAASMDQKLLRQTKFPPEFSQKVDMTKVNVEVMKRWIAGKISDILGSEDDIVTELCFNLLEGSRFPDIKVLQIQLTGFLDKDTASFCRELWTLCLSAQSNPQGVPKELLEAKKLELIQEKVGHYARTLLKPRKPQRQLSAGKRLIKSTTETLTPLDSESVSTETGVEAVGEADIDLRLAILETQLHPLDDGDLQEITSLQSEENLTHMLLRAAWADGKKDDTARVRDQQHVLDPQCGAADLDANLTIDQVMVIRARDPDPFHRHGSAAGCQAAPDHHCALAVYERSLSVILEADPHLFQIFHAHHPLDIVKGAARPAPAPPDHEVLHDVGTTEGDRLRIQIQDRQLVRIEAVMARTTTAPEDPPLFPRSNEPQSVLILSRAFVAMTTIV